MVLDALPVPVVNGLGAGVAALVVGLLQQRASPEPDYRRALLVAGVVAFGFALGNAVF